MACGKPDEWSSTLFMEYIYTLVYYIWVEWMGETTAIRVSKSTLKMLERLRRKLSAQTLDETIRLFTLQRRRERLREVFGIDKGKIRPFTEGDRGEDSG